MTVQRLWGLFILLVGIGCGPGRSTGSSGLAEGTGSSGSTTGASTDTGESGRMPDADTSAGSTTAEESGTLECDFVELCSNFWCPEECTGTVSCPGAFIFACACDCPTQCDMNETLSMYVGEEALDCGVATLTDDLETWEAVRTCVLELALTTGEFKAIFHLQGIDSSPYDGFAGRGTREYVLSRLGQDLGGVPGVTTISERTCERIDERAACTVSVGDHCLECVAPQETGPICGP